MATGNAWRLTPGLSSCLWKNIFVFFGGYTWHVRVRFHSWNDSHLSRKLGVVPEHCQGWPPNEKARQCKTKNTLYGVWGPCTPVFDSWLCSQEFLLGIGGPNGMLGVGSARCKAGAFPAGPLPRSCSANPFPYPLSPALGE